MLHLWLSMLADATAAPPRIPPALTASAESPRIAELAGQLVDAGLPLAAMQLYGLIATRGPTDPLFETALAQLVVLAHATGDWSEVDRVTVPFDATPCCADALRYRAAIRQVAAGDFVGASETLKNIGEQAVTTPRAKVTAGHANAHQGKLKSAVRAYTDAVRSSSTVSTQAELDALNAARDRAMIGIARVYAGISQGKEALRYYSVLPAASKYRSLAAVEMAWVHLLSRDLDAMSAALTTLEGTPWTPEAALLRLAFASASGMPAEPGHFRAAVEPVRAELRTTLATADPVKLRWSFAALPSGVAARLHLDEALEDTVRALAQVERELDLVRRAKQTQALEDDLLRRKGELEARQAARLAELYMLHLAALDRLVTLAEALEAPAPAGETPADRLERIRGLLREPAFEPDGGPPLHWVDVAAPAAPP